MSKKYDDSAIQHFSGLQWIKYNPLNHINSTSTSGRIHALRELFDNSLDEAEHPSSPGSNILVYMFRDVEHQTYQFMIKDNGRGIPHGAIVRAFTELFNSGKYSNSLEGAYTFSAGSNGVGSKVSSGLSIDFRAIGVRDGYFSSMYMHNADVDNLIHVTDIPADPSLHGTMIVTAPSEEVFTDGLEFLESGYKEFTKLCYLVTMFSKKVNIVFKIVDEPLNNKFWKMPVDKAWDYIEKTYDRKAYVEVDGNNEEATMAYLKEIWQLSENEKFIWSLLDISHPFTSDISYDISIYLPKTLRSTSAIMMVNNVPLTDMSSSPLSVLITCIKDKLAKYIKDEHKDYFLNIYKLPICCAVSAKCIGAKFTGLAKNGFKNAAFEKTYFKLLTKDLDTVYEEDWEELYKLIAKDIEVKYLVYYNKPLSKQKANKTSLDIIDPVYFDCKTSDRSNAELYVVEGVSASHIVNSRDPETQALLMIYGKPKNVLKTGNSGRTPQSIFENYEVYKRFERILDIHPKQEDLSNAQFGKIILMNDADIDGGHIQALHIGGLWTLNPRIITSGMVYLANPPLYVIKDPSGKKGNKYIQDKNSLIRFFIDCMYRNTFDIYIKDNKAFKEPTKLDNDSFTDFCYIITELGELFDHLSAKLAIPPLILEKLTYLTPYLQPGMINGSKLEEALGRGCSYNKYTDILTVIGDKEDYSFALEGVADAFYEELMGYLRSLCWKELQIYVSTKFTNTLNMNRVSIVQLYQMFVSLNNLLSVTRQKGLGGMKKEDLAPLCMRKDTRVLHQITSLGDFERIQSLLGDDVKARKEILRIHGLESSDY